MNTGKKLFQDYLKANAEAVKRFQEENEKLRKQYEAIIEKEKDNVHPESRRRRIYGDQVPGPVQERNKSGQVRSPHAKSYRMV